MQRRLVTLLLYSVMANFMLGCTGPVAPADARNTSGGAPAHFVEVGIASWYGPHHQGRITASGERFDMHKLTAAHRSLPLETRARVTNLENGKSVEVTINDRGPYVGKRVIDLSEKAAARLGMKRQGVAKVRVEALQSETAGAAGERRIVREARTER